MQYPGMKERLERELLAVRPFQSQFKVQLLLLLLNKSFICYFYNSPSVTRYRTCHFSNQYLKSRKVKEAEGLRGKMLQFFLILKILNLVCVSEVTLNPDVTSPQVTLASQPALGSWFGAKAWALEHPPVGGGTEGWISRQDYEEKGGEYLSEHSASNLFIPMKIVKPVPVRSLEATQTLGDPSPPPLPPAAAAVVSTETPALTPSSTDAADVCMVTS